MPAKVGINKKGLFLEPTFGLDGAFDVIAAPCRAQFPRHEAPRSP
jgi:hypothetical protein